MKQCFLSWFAMHCGIFHLILLCFKFKFSFAIVQSLSCVWLFVTPWTAACQAFLSFTISWSLLKLMSIELVMPSKHLILCCPLLLLPSIFPSIRIFFSELVLHIRWLKYWSFSFSISSSNEYSLGSTHYGLLMSYVSPRWLQPWLEKHYPSNI